MLTTLKYTQLIFQEKQDPIIRSVLLPYLVHATAFPQVSLFLASFWSTFSLEMEAKSMIITKKN